MTAEQSASVSFATLDEWLAWQESLHSKDIKLGLERCRRVKERMALGPLAPTVVTVAGTNGKGSSVAMLASIWRAAGYRIGTYTSPHIHRYNERIRLHGRPVSDEAICTAFAQVEQARDDIALTYFEFGTLAAFSIFCQQELDIVILEVGLGGRLDAVNIVEPDIALIAAIGIDHVEYLGHTREAIGHEKAGIMRAAKPAVCSDPNVPDSVLRVARDLPTHLDVLGVSFRYVDEGSTWVWWSGETTLTDLPKPSLAGEYQLRNASGVVKVIDLLKERLPVSRAEIASGLVSVKLPGRFQRIRGSIELVLDVAHNPQAVNQLVLSLSALPPARRTHVLLGMLKDKDHTEIFRLLNSIADSYHLATLTDGRGATSETLHAALKTSASKSFPASTYDSVLAAYEGVMSQAEQGDRIVALGSFLVVSDVLARVESPAKAQDNETSS